MIKLNPNNYKSENIFSIEGILPILEELKKQNKKVGLCTGSFDFLHPGHITHLESAKKMCDVLIVGLAKDHFSKNKYGVYFIYRLKHCRHFSRMKRIDTSIFNPGSK